MTDYP